MNELLLINGVVIDPARDVRQKMHCRVRGGKIAEWTQSKHVPAGVRVVDLAGACLCPGFIDIHVHLRDPGEEYKEDIFSGSAAAVAGGFSSIACLANTTPTNDCAAVTRYIIERAATANLARIYPIGAISKGLAGEALADIGDMAVCGIVAVSDDGKTVANTQLMRRALEYAGEFGLPVVAHCEDPHLCHGTVMHEGAVSSRIGLAGAPAAAEEIIVQRDLALAALTGARLHIQHVTCAGAVDAIRTAKESRLRVTAEATPHHLLLTDAALADFHPVYKMNPPLRTEHDQAALRKGLRDGTIDVIATDHAPHHYTEKDEMPIETAACGVIGLESAVPVSYRLVEEKVISLTRFVELFTSGPARALNLPHGRLAVGDTADITIFDPTHEVRIDTNAFRSKSRNSPFHGWKCHGRVLYTIVGGRVVYEGRA